jgi:hypothetical protein
MSSFFFLSKLNRKTFHINYYVSTTSHCIYRQLSLRRTNWGSLEICGVHFVLQHNKKKMEQLGNCGVIIYRVVVEEINGLWV